MEILESPIRVIPSETTGEEEETQSFIVLKFNQFLNALRYKEMHANKKVQRTTARDVSEEVIVHRWV